MRNFHFLLKTNFHAKNGQKSTHPNTYMYEVNVFSVLFHAKNPGQNKVKVDFIGQSLNGIWYIG